MTWHGLRHRVSVQELQRLVITEEAPRRVRVRVRIRTTWLWWTRDVVHEFWSGLGSERHGVDTIRLEAVDG